MTFMYMLSILAASNNELTAETICETNPTDESRNIADTTSVSTVLSCLLSFSRVLQAITDAMQKPQIDKIFISSARRHSLLSEKDCLSG